MLTENNKGSTHAYDLTETLTGTEEIDSPTLVFIHGWLLSRAYWQPVTAQLSADYRCLSYDLRGFGESAVLDQPKHHDAQLSEGSNSQISIPSGKVLSAEASSENVVNNGTASVKTDCTDQTVSYRMETYQPSRYSLAAYARDLETLLNDLNINNVWVIGHSLGGSIALWAAYLQPERVQGVICINAGGGIYIPKEFEKFRAAGQQMVKFRPRWLPTFPLLPRLFSRIMVNKPLSPRWGKQRLKDFVNAEAVAAVGALLETTTQSEVHLLPQIVSLLTQPVHFITATEDSIMPPRYVRHLASFHPQFKEQETVSELSNCGHMAMVEQPEAVAKIVRDVVNIDG
ncbi:MAG: alpha/beta hydrolase [Cyanobacteria bacterium P01_C01_bin.121]